MATDLTEIPAEAPVGAPPKAKSTRSHYRPQLDGLRAVAVYLVVAYHAGIASFSGGFVGVDVFFVLSGYLVTRLLLRDIGALTRIDFRRFYSRRFRRLLPAAFAALLVTAAVYVAIATPADAQSALGGFRSAFLYVANWHFIQQSTDYFATNVNTNPVVHFWSLAVEEQFYLLWPVLLSVMFLATRRAGRRQWNIVRTITALIIVSSMIGALLVSRSNLSRAYYGTDTRAYELLAGAFLAMTPFLLRRAKQRGALVRGLAPFNIALIVLFATSSIHLGAIQRGVAITVLTCTLILALEASSDGAAVRTLSSPTAVYLGRVSYGTYLWHWPVIVIITQRFHPGSAQLFAITCLIGTALAALSYEILERPIRQSQTLDRYRVPVIAAGLTISLVSGLVFVPAILHHKHNGSAGAGSIADSLGGGGWRIPVTAHVRQVDSSVNFDSTGCYNRPVAHCIVANGTKQRILLIGDSHALTFIPMFSDIAKHHSMTFAVAYTVNCAWQQGIAPHPFGEKASGPGSCLAQQNDWYSRVVPQFKPDIIVLASRGIEDPANHVDLQTADGRRIAYGDPSFAGTLQAAAQRTLTSLRAPGRKVVVIEPLPLAPGGVQPLNCLSGAKYLDDCRYVATAETSPIVKYYRSVADGTSLVSLNFDRLVCPYFPICDPVVDNTVVKADAQHITAAYSRLIAPTVDTLLTRDGILR